MFGQINEVDTYRCWLLSLPPSLSLSEEKTTTGYANRGTWPEVWIPTSPTVLTISSGIGKAAQRLENMVLNVI